MQTSNLAFNISSSYNAKVQIENAKKYIISLRARYFIKHTQIMHSVKGNPAAGGIREYM